MTRLWTIGVDPGQTGGFAYLGPDGECYVYPMPLIGKEVDLESIKQWCAIYGPRFTVDYWDGWHAWIEKAQAFPGVMKPETCRKCGLVTQRRQSQGVVSTGTFMRGAGLIWGCLIGMGIECTQVDAKDWQKIMLLRNAQGALAPVPRGRKALKAASIAKARKLFPSVDFKRTPRCKTHSDGMTDSALIAAYGSRITVV